MAFSSVSYLREYKHTHLSKVLVSNGFSNIYNGLVKDRISYALHNPQEIMTPCHMQYVLYKCSLSGHTRKPRPTLVISVVEIDSDDRQGLCLHRQWSYFPILGFGTLV